MTADWLFDIPLGLGLLWLAWRTVTTDSLLIASMLLTVFGLLMTLVWARLDAPDLALAEAAIGAGITGALLLDSYRVLVPDQDNRMIPISLRWPLGLALTGVLVALGWLLIDRPPVAPQAVIADHIADSGVTNPVTAVLLNFRGYDTLLEVVVLLLALLGTGAVSRGIDNVGILQDHMAASSELIDSLLRLLIPLATLIAAYLLWAGSHAPGGAFQAGAVLAALGMLGRLTNTLYPSETAPWPLRYGIALGLAVFCTVAWATLLTGSPLLTYPTGWAGGLILTVESALTVSIALILTLLFSGTAGLRIRSQ